MDGVSTDSLLHNIKGIHQRASLDGQKMVAMGFDGAAAMKSLAQELKSETAPNAISVHCFAHCTELIVKHAIKESGLLAASLDLCQSMHAIVGAYPKLILLFENIQKGCGCEQETCFATCLETPLRHKLQKRLPRVTCKYPLSSSLVLVYYT